MEEFRMNNEGSKDVQVSRKIQVPSSVSSTECRQNLSEIISKVSLTGRRITIEHRGKGIAGLVPIQQLRLLEHLESQYPQEFSQLLGAVGAASMESEVSLSNTLRLLGKS